MNIDDTIYVNRPELIDLDEDVVDFADLSEAMHEAASAATEISILGGFYNAGALVYLCEQVPKRRRRGCRVRIAVGLEAAALIPQTWEDMRGVDRRLRDMGFRDVTVAVVSSSPVHFHTKLFRILRATRPVWFIGSANPGSKRHELMVRISGRHEALSDYVDAVFDNAKIVTDTPPLLKIATLRDLFLTGILCHKPPAQRLFTFDAFRLTPETRDHLMSVLTREGGIEHARPRTEGFGFSLKSALGVDDWVNAEDEDTGLQRTQYRRSYIDTVLGFWMPRAYAQEIQHRMADERNSRLRGLERFAHLLTAQEGQFAARKAFSDHVTSMERLLAGHSIDARPVEDRDRAFERFLISRLKILSDEKARSRIARTMTLTNMPDIWDDRSVSEDFEISFFEDLAYRFSSQGGRAGRVVRSFADALRLFGGETADDIQAALEKRLSTRPWEEEEWRE